MKVGDVYESDVATYEIVGETPMKWKIHRINKSNHPCSPNKDFRVYKVWKNMFSIDKLKKINY